MKSVERIGRGPKRVLLVYAFFVILGTGCGEAKEISSAKPLASPQIKAPEPTVDPAGESTKFVIDPSKPPYAAGVVVGQDYPYLLPTHCGVANAFIDGRDWDADPPLSADTNNPPPGWDENAEPGQMRLLSPDRASFRSDKDPALVALFKARERPLSKAICE